MIVFALLAAAIAAPPPPKPCPADGRFEISDRSPALLLRPEDRRGAAGARTLASLPPANMELAVIRSVDGCSISTVVREKIQGDGRFAKPR